MEHQTLNRTALSATLHCLTGCAIGEVAGLIVGTAVGFTNLQTIVLSIALAFLFGYGLSVRSVTRSGIAFKTALSLVLAADTLSIATMELADSVVVSIIPGAMDAGLSNILFWVSMLISLTAAFIAAFPVNRYLLKRGKGHALTHAHHH